MGPGTHIFANIINGVQPKSYHDALALMHDIDYLEYGSANKLEVALADDQAINNSNYSLQGILMQMGLSIRKFLDLPFAGKANPEAAEYLRKVLAADFIMRGQFYQTYDYYELLFLYEQWLYNK